MVDRRVVYHMVDAAEARAHGVDHAANRSDIAHVDLHAPGLLPWRERKRGGQRLDRRQADVGQHEVQTVGGEFSDDGLADGAARARNDRNLPAA